MKNNALPFIGAVLSLALLAGCSSTTWQWSGGKRLSACTADGGPFENMDLDKWPETYHGTVSKVIEAHMKKMQETSAADITCTADDYAGMMKATPELAKLASDLEPWKGRQVSELEMAPVLREYLRVYECSLEETGYFLPGSQSSSVSSSGIPRGKYMDEKSKDRALIGRELASSRMTLERTLALISGTDRLQPLALDVECIRRASLDLRNVLGLAAESAACMPRATDVRGSLRDLKDDPDSE